MIGESGKGVDGVAVVRYPGPMLQEAARWHGHWSVEKFDAPVDWYAARVVATHGTLDDVEAVAHMRAFSDLPAHIQEAASAAMRADVRPYDVGEFDHLLLNAGITAMLNILYGNSSAANSGASPAGANAIFNNTQARIAIGDSTTAAAATQTDLQASTNKWYQVMDASYPSVAGQVITFRVTVASGNGNFAWQEFAADNCGGSNATSTTRSGGATLSRAVSNQGTKAAGQTWVPSYTVTIS